MAAVGRYRYPFGQLVRRDLRRNYQGPSLGVLWYVVSPPVLRGAYTLMFGLIDQGGIVRRVRFPEETIPAGAVTVQLVTFAVVLVLLIPLSLSPRGSRASVSLLLLPVLVAALFCSALGLVLVGRSWR